MYSESMSEINGYRLSSRVEDKLSSVIFKFFSPAAQIIISGIILPIIVKSSFLL